jgi:hypothetical protein
MTLWSALMWCPYWPECWSGKPSSGLTRWSNLLTLFHHILISTYFNCGGQYSRLLGWVWDNYCLLFLRTSACRFWGHLNKQSISLFASFSMSLWTFTVWLYGLLELKRFLGCLNSIHHGDGEQSPFFSDIDISPSSHQQLMLSTLLHRTRA